MTQAKKSAGKRKTARKVKAVHHDLPPLDPLRRYPIPITLKYLGIGLTRLYQDINDGRIKTIKDGTRTFVPGSEIVRVSTLPSQ